MKLFVNKILFSENIKIACNFLSKLRGIIGLYIPVLLTNTNAIHTFFLRRKLNIYFLDKNNIVVKKFTEFPPNRIIFPVKNAASVLEFCSTNEKSAKINLGDRIELSE